MYKMKRNALFAGVPGVLLHILTQELFDLFIQCVRCPITGRGAHDIGYLSNFMFRFYNGVFLFQKSSPFRSNRLKVLSNEKALIGRQLAAASRDFHPCMVLMQPYPLPATL